MTKADPYYSRINDQWEVAPRLEPIVSDEAGPLTTDEVWNYARDGLLFIQELFSQEEVETLLQESSRLLDEADAGEAGLIREPHNPHVVRSVFHLDRRSSVFRNLFSDPRLLDRVRQLIGTDVYLHQSRVNYKPAMDGKEFFWHSDFETWHVEDGMPRMRAVSVSIFLTESHEFNGPLMLIPGSHEIFVRCVGETPNRHFKQSLQHQRFGVPCREALEMLLEDRDIIAPKGPAGSVVIFDCNTMHGSSGNLTPTPRVNAFAVYNSVDNQLKAPYCGLPPRPEFLAERTVRPLRSPEN